MLRIKLTAAEQAAAEYLHNDQKSTPARSVPGGVDSLAEGRKRKAIAQDLEVHRTTVLMMAPTVSTRRCGGLRDSVGTGVSEPRS